MREGQLIIATPRQDGFLRHAIETITQRLSNKAAAYSTFDLCQIAFDPSLDAHDLESFYLSERTPASLRPFTQSLDNARFLIFVFPIWMYFMPAVLKGYFDRVWRPGVAFRIGDGGVKPLLRGLRNVLVVASAGQPADEAKKSQQLCDEFFAQLLRQNAPNAKFDTIMFAGRDGAQCMALSDQDKSRLKSAVDNAIE